MRVKPKGLPDGDCCSPWQKIMERLREVETGLSQRVKKVKVNGTTIYPVNDGEIVLPDYPESGGSVESVSVNGTKYLPDAQGDVGLPDYPADLSDRMDAVEGKCDGYDIEIPALDGRLESVEDDVGTLDTAVTGLGNRLDTAEGDIDGLEGRMDIAEGDIDDLEIASDDLNNRMNDAENDITTLSTAMPTKPTMYTGVVDPTTSTEGEVGDFYLNTADDKLWKCLTSSVGNYGWTAVGSGAALPINIAYYDGGLDTFYYNGDSYTPSDFVTNVLDPMTTNDMRKLVIWYSQDGGEYTYQYKSIGFCRFTGTPKMGYGSRGNELTLKYFEISTNGVNISTNSTITGINFTYSYVQAGSYTAGQSFTATLKYVNYIGLASELYSAYVNGDITVTVNSPNTGTVTLTVVNPITITSSQRIDLRATGLDTSPVIVYNYSLGNPVVDFEKGSSGGDEVYYERWKTDVNYNSFTKGTTTLNRAEFYDHVMSLSDEERANIVLIVGGGYYDPLWIAYFEKAQYSRLYFYTNTYLEPFNQDGYVVNKYFSFMRDTVGTSQEKVFKYACDYPSDYKNFKKLNTAGSETTIVYSGGYGLEYISLDADLYSAYQNGDCVIENGANGIVVLRFVNEVDLSSSNNANCYMFYKSGYRGDVFITSNSYYASNRRFVDVGSLLTP